MPTKKRKPTRDERPDRHRGVAVLVRALDDAQRERWRDAADKMGQSLQDWIREALDAVCAAAKREGYDDASMGPRSRAGKSPKTDQQTASMGPGASARRGS